MINHHEVRAGIAAILLGEATDRDCAAEALAEQIQEAFIVAPRELLKCATHDGIPSTEEEDAEWEDGGDPCQFVIRVE